MRVHFAFQGAWNEAKVREGRGSAASFPGLARPQFLITCSMERECLHGWEISHYVGWTHIIEGGNQSVLNVLCQAPCIPPICLPEITSHKGA